MEVSRVGLLKNGYTTRVALVMLSLSSLRTGTRRDAVAYVGCGAAWALVELALSLGGVREGAITLVDDDAWLTALAALLRGFSEGASVLVCGMRGFEEFDVGAIVGVLCADAALSFPDSGVLSTRDVLTPFSVAFTLTWSLLWLWRLYRGTNLISLLAVRRMMSIGLAWNVASCLSGSRLVSPEDLTMAFILYDSIFEVALLYAGLAEVTLIAFARNVR